MLIISTIIETLFKRQTYVVTICKNEEQHGSNHKNI